MFIGSIVWEVVSAAVVDVARIVVFVGAVAVWITLAFSTARRAARLGRDETMWMLYGFGLPVVSLVHSIILERRQQSGAGDGQ